MTCLIIGKNMSSLAGMGVNIYFFAHVCIDTHSFCESFTANHGFKIKSMNSRLKISIVEGKIFG